MTFVSLENIVGNGVFAHDDSNDEPILYFQQYFQIHSKFMFSFLQGNLSIHHILSLSMSLKKAYGLKGLINSEIDVVNRLFTPEYMRTQFFRFPFYI